MKSNILFSALSLLGIIACQPKGAEGDLAKLREEKDSLVTLKDEVSARLLEVDAAIAELDTTQRLTLVTSIEVRKDTFDHFFEVMGEVYARQNVLILPETQGVIEKILVEEGQQVKEGQLLLQLDGDILRSNISEIKTQLDLATTIYDKRKVLWDQNIGSEVEFLQAKNNKESLEARLKALQAQFEFTQVRAPFSGYVDDIPAKVGEMASPAMPLLRLISLDDVYVKADVSERYLVKIEEGTHVDVHFENVNVHFPASISQVGNFIKPENRTFQIRVELDNPDKLLKPNLLADLFIRDYRNVNAIVLPNRVIQQSPDGRSFVYLFEKNKGQKGQVVRRYISTGLSYEGLTEVKSGLTGGESVVDKGSRSVKDGQRVKRTTA